MDTESKLKITSVRNWHCSNCRKGAFLEALLLTFIHGLELGAFAKHNQYCLAIKISWSGTILYLQYTCSTETQRVVMWHQVGKGWTHTRNLDYTDLVSRLLVPFAYTHELVIRINDGKIDLLVWCDVFEIIVFGVRLFPVLQTLTAH